MPEGPEILRSTHYLDGLLAGKRMRSVQVYHTPAGPQGRYAKKPPEGLTELCNFQHAGNTIVIEQIDCKGKFMHWTFSHGWKMWCTYGMSGRWSTQEPDKHTALLMWTDDPPDHGFSGRGLRALAFRDPRHFGTVKFVHDPDGSKTAKKLASLGPDMLSDPPDNELFSKRLDKRVHKTIAEALMDQSVVSGVGNYLKAESLYLAEISPHRTVASLSAQERARLNEQITNVMKASYNTGGATISTYRNPDGSKGRAQRRFAVYAQSHDPMGNEVIREETKDGRTTWWVPSVQR